MPGVPPGEFPVAVPMPGAGSLQAEAGPAAAAGSSRRGRILANLAIWFLFTSLLLDGFPPGALVLREFGSRPTNFLLIFAVLAVGMSQRMQGRRPALAMRDAYVLLTVLFVIPVFNLPVTILQARGAGSTVLLDWVKQYLMLGWGVTSFYVWKTIVGRMGRDRYCALLCLGAVLPVLFFFLEYFDTSYATHETLDIFRFKTDWRPSSFATEPSIYAAWIAFVWPIVLYSARKLQRGFARTGASVLLIAMAVGAYLSEARTFAVIVLLQLGYLGFWAVQKRQAWGRRLRSLLLTLCIGSTAVLVLMARLATLTDLSDNVSNVARLAYTVTGVEVALAHPVVGVGIGQFGNYFGEYVPQFASGIAEVEQHAAGISQFRALTFNLFVRFACEFGFPLGIVFSAIVVWPLLRAPKSSVTDPFLRYAALSAVGGVGFWLSQDPYGYQPGILALAVVSLILSQAKSSDARLEGRQ